jgi:FdrA protein
MITTNIVRENTYLDSVLLMSVSSELKKTEGVVEVSTIMGTAANKSILKASGLLTGPGEQAKSGDLIIALKVSDKAAEKRALEMAEELLTRRAADETAGEEALPKTYAEALRANPSATIAVISLPGLYAGREAMKVLESGRSVMLFSDNVPVEEEIALKRRAAQLDLLVMGPDCGTAIINGTALGFANVVRKGPFGIVGASGTGIQEVTTILHKRGYGITQAIGLGGRDLSAPVGGLSMLQGIKALEKDTETKIVVLISKPPAPEVAKKILDFVKPLKKRYVINFLKGDPAEAKKRNLPFAPGLEEAAELAIAVREGTAFVPRSFSDDEARVKARAREEKAKIGAGKFLRGLFSGGTLADESLLILSREIGDIRSNIPLQPSLKLQNSSRSEGHTIVDLGEDEFTRGRPHPMIDYTLRCDRLVEEAKDPGTGVLLLDVVLGYGSHADPAAELVPAIAKTRKAAGKRYLSCIASICGTDEDPQGYSRQKEALEKAGVIVLPSNAQAARFAALVLK